MPTAAPKCFYNEMKFTENQGWIYKNIECYEY